ncbi:hypothetical protein QOZ80_7AG0568770 [Eleusine coracana subsp. coracana]|nr:hypothetical protein QOZ80_7AG0568770 [Eleusine coracana subsp. coracana]
MSSSSSIFESFAWWKDYQCSPVSPEEMATGKPFCLLMSKYPLTDFARWKFANSPTGQSYLEAEIHSEPAGRKPIRIATTQLEFATPPAPMWCLERYAQAEHAVTALSSGENVLKWPKKEIKFMTYNVWSRDDVFVHKRMQAIGSLVEKHDPDVIFFQEVTPHIRSIFESSAWWKEYNSAPVYTEEQATNQKQDFCLLTGKGYLEADINPDPGSTLQPIHVATTQLERPAPPASMYYNERVAQAQQAIAAFSSAANVVFGGDMSWRDDNDGPFPLATGWSDAWTKLRSSFRSSWTYEGIWNEEGGVFNGHVACRGTMRKRSDRFVCKLKDYRLSSIELIGDHTIGPRYRTIETEPSFIYVKPSCHRGVVLTIVPK